MAEAYGDLMAFDERSKKGWGLVRIYNPEGHSMADVLLMDQKLRNGKQEIRTKALAHESIQIDDDRYWLPRYYIVKHNLFDACPQCDQLDTAPLASMTISDWHELVRERMDS